MKRFEYWFNNTSDMEYVNWIFAFSINIWKHDQRNFKYIKRNLAYKYLHIELILFGKVLTMEYKYKIIVDESCKTEKNMIESINKELKEILNE